MNDNQVKGRIRNIAKEKNVSAQEILQIFLFERVIERLSKSKYKKNFGYSTIKWK